MRRRSAARLGAGLLLGAVLASAAGGAAYGDDPHDIPLTVQVTGTASSSPGAGAATGTGSGTNTGTLPGRGGAGAAPAEAVVAVPTTGTSTPPGTESVAGGLAVGGLSTSYTSSRNPLDGTVHVQMTVQNLSSEVIEPDVTFWLTNAIGMQLDKQDGQSLGAIAPGELRVARADLTGVGQWTVVDVHMTLTPPAQIGGVRVDPVTRDRWIFARPWFVTVVLVITVGVLAAWRWSAQVPAVLAPVQVAS